MRHFFFILLIWTLALVAIGSGCSALSWDATRKHADNLGPGVTVEGSKINIWRDKDETVIIAAAPKKAMAEIREAPHIRTINDTSNFDIFRYGSSDKLNQETSIDKKGNINLFGRQTVAGLTVLNLILIIAAIAIGPLIIGGLLTLHPATAVLGLGIIGFYKGLIPSGLVKPPVKTTVVESKLNKAGGSKVTTTETTSKGK